MGIKGPPELWNPFQNTVICWAGGVMLTFRREATGSIGPTGVGGRVRVGSGVNRGRAVGSGVAVGAGITTGAAVAVGVLGAIVATGVGAGVADGAGTAVGGGATGGGVGVVATSTGSSPPVHIELIKTTIATMPTRMCNMILSDLPFRRR